MKEYLSDIIQKVDIFGQPISLKLNGEITTKTFLGGLLTIFLILASLVIFFIFSRDTFGKLNPFVSLETQNLHPRL